MACDILYCTFIHGCRHNNRELYRHKYDCDYKTEMRVTLIKHNMMIHNTIPLIPGYYRIPEWFAQDH